MEHPLQGEVVVQIDDLVTMSDVSAGDDSNASDKTAVDWIQSNHHAQDFHTQVEELRKRTLSGVETWVASYMYGPVAAGPERLQLMYYRAGYKTCWDVAQFRLKVWDIKDASTDIDVTDTVMKTYVNYQAEILSNEIETSIMQQEREYETYSTMAPHDDPDKYGRRCQLRQTCCRCPPVSCVCGHCCALQ